LEWPFPATSFLWNRLPGALTTPPLSLPFTKEHKFQRTLQKHREREKERERERWSLPASGFGLEIVGNRGRAVILDGAGELVDLTTEIHQIDATFTLPQIYYRVLFVHHALYLFTGQRARRRLKFERGVGFKRANNS
jgi:hypothetical protein